MADELPGYRTSSARRRRGGLSLLTAAVAVVVVIFATLAILDRNPESPLQPQSTTPSPVPTIVPTRTATATVLVERSSEWVALAPTTTPSPWPTIAAAATATPRPQPSPTPRPSDCVTYRWSSHQVFRPSAQVLVEIDAVNGCNRDLGPLELWFEITGWRQGSRVQSVRGHSFDRIRRGGSGIIAIGLPGSIDWYDEITVEIAD